MYYINWVQKVRCANVPAKGTWKEVVCYLSELKIHVFLWNFKMLWAKNIVVGKNTKIEQCVSASDELSDYDDDDGVEQLWLAAVQWKYFFGQKLNLKLNYTIFWITGGNNVRSTPSHTTQKLRTSTSISDLTTQWNERTIAGLIDKSET